MQQLKDRSLSLTRRSGKRMLRAAGTLSKPVKCYEHLTGPRIQAPSRAHARYSNDREFSTRQHAEKLPSVLKGNRKRIGKKAAQSNAERSGARGRLTISTETPLNAQGSRTPHEAPPDKRPARKSCGAPSESQPAATPLLEQARLNRIFAAQGCKPLRRNRLATIQNAR